MAPWWTRPILAGTAAAVLLGLLAVGWWLLGHRRGSGQSSVPSIAAADSPQHSIAPAVGEQPPTAASIAAVGSDLPRPSNANVPAVSKDRSENPAFTVRVEVDHRDGIYRGGEKMYAKVVSERDGYLYLLYRSADGPGVAIYLCSQTGPCTPAAFGTSPVVTDADVGGDGDTMPTPAPFLVDPLDTTQLLIGTCRVWRGPAEGAGWSASTPRQPHPRQRSDGRFVQWGRAHPRHRRAAARRRRRSHLRGHVRLRGLRSQLARPRFERHSGDPSSGASPPWND